MKSFQDLVDENSKLIDELMPWDLEKKLNQSNPPMLLDIREPAEFAAMHIKASINVPRGILEIVCDYENEEHAAELVNARQQPIIVICGSGKRSVMAASTMRAMGYTKSTSLKTGIKGWNDFDLPLIDKTGTLVDPDQVEVYLSFNTTPQQFAK